MSAGLQPGCWKQLWYLYQVEASHFVQPRNVTESLSFFLFKKNTEIELFFKHLIVFFKYKATFLIVFHAYLGLPKQKM